MEIVIDTTVICQDYRLSGPSFRALQDGLRVIPANLHVPEVVLDEAVNRFREDLAEVQIKRKKLANELSRLLPDENNAYEDDVKVDSAADEYADRLKERLQDFDANILPYPKLDHKRIVKRDLQRRRPFQRDGSGYRDYLIWESVRGIMLWGSERVAFISNNSKDFCEGEELARDLKDDILNPQRLEIFRGLKHFNEKHVLPRLTMFKGVEEKLKANKLGNLDLPLWLRESIVDLIYDDELGFVLYGFPHGAGQITPHELVAIHELKVDEVLELSSNQRLAHISADIEVSFGVDIDDGDFVHEEIRSFWGDDSGRFAGGSSEFVERLQLGIALIVVPESVGIVSQELRYIEGNHGQIDFG